MIDNMLGELVITADKVKAIASTEANSAIFRGIVPLGITSVGCGRPS